MVATTVHNHELLTPARFTGWGPNPCRARPSPAVLPERTTRRVHPLPWDLPVPLRLHGDALSTRCRDLALGPSLFHWESQCTTTATSPTGEDARERRLLVLDRIARRGLLTTALAGDQAPEALIRADRER